MGSLNLTVVNLQERAPVHAYSTIVLLVFLQKYYSTPPRCAVLLHVVVLLYSDNLHQTLTGFIVPAFLQVGHTLQGKTALSHTLLWVTNIAGGAH